MEVSNRFGWEIQQQKQGSTSTSSISDDSAASFEALLQQQLSANNNQTAATAGYSPVSTTLVQAASSSQATDPSNTNPIESPQSVYTSSGIDVIVSGHSADKRDGIEFISQPSNQDLATLQAQLANFAANNNPVAGLTVISSVALDANSPGYENVSPHGIASGWDTSKTAMSLDNYDSEYRGRVQGYAEVIDAERELKAKYGEDIKVIYSGADDSYIMLTKDDFGYDRAESAESAVSGILESVYNGSIDRSAVQDILQRYGYSV